jgi:hypothetical protein
MSKTDWTTEERKLQSVYGEWSRSEIHVQVDYLSTFSRPFCPPTSRRRAGIPC